MKKLIRSCCAWAQIRSPRAPGPGPATRVLFRCSHEKSGEMLWREGGEGEEERCYKGIRAEEKFISRESIRFFAPLFSAHVLANWRGFVLTDSQTVPINDFRFCSNESFDEVPSGPANKTTDLLTSSSSDIFQSQGEAMLMQRVQLNDRRRRLHELTATPLALSPLLSLSVFFASLSSCLPACLSLSLSLTRRLIMKCAPAICTVDLSFLSFFPADQAVDSLDCCCRQHTLFPVCTMSEGSHVRPEISMFVVRLSP